MDRYTVATYLTNLVIVSAVLSVLFKVELRPEIWFVTGGVTFIMLNTVDTFWGEWRKHSRREKAKQ